MDQCVQGDVVERGVDVVGGMIELGNDFANFVAIGCIFGANLGPTGSHSGHVEHQN